jgi:hypothetical protein
MPFSLSRPHLALALLIAALGCSKRHIVTDQDSAHWISITQTPALRVALDSARIQAESLGTSIWLRFDYTATNPPMTDIPQPWRRMESRHLLDCAARRAKDIAMIIVDTAGARHDGSHVLSSGWKSFDTHPLTPHVFGPVCVALQSIAARRGA